MLGVKLVICGGGGFRVPLVYEAVSTAATGLRIDDLVLYDVDAERLEVIGRVVAQLGEELSAAGRVPAPGLPALKVTTDLREALSGADVVFSAIRVGGTEGRTVDERVALGLGVLGQETIGPGGLAYALRTIPEAMRIARMIAEVAPRAWTINFTNPAGIVTEAMRTVLGDRVVGICDTPIGLVRRAGRLLGLDPTGDDRVEIDYAGVNHLGWLRALRVDGVDRLPEILADDAALEEIEEARLLGFDVVRAMGALPNEYLYYYLFAEQARASIEAAGRTRGEYLARQQAEFYRAARVSEDPLGAWRAALGEREATYMAETRGEDEERREEDVAGGGYQEVALRLMAALITGRPERMILDVGNGAAGAPPSQRAIAQLPADMVVEVPCIADADGVHPERVGELTLDQLGLIAQLRASERALLAAALEGRGAEDAWWAMAIHPVVRSVETGRALAEGYAGARRDGGAGA